MHHQIFLRIFVLYLSLVNFDAFAIESKSNREALVSPRSKKFYKSNSSKQYLSFGGNQTSDYNSKSYEINSRYLYQSQNFIHEINFQNENKYSDIGSGTNKKYQTKTSELYDLSIASKARIKSSQNYAVFFHRTIYDDLSKYYYDLHTALGLGRMFFKERVELDLSLGYQDVKTYGNKVDLIPSIRTNFKISQNLTLIQRGYLFIDRESTDNQLKSSLVYRLNEKMSLELRHNFEQRRYEQNDKKLVTNQVNRSTTFGLVFDLN
jgi:hypothetical protein